MKSSIAAPTPEPVVGTIGIVTTPVPAPTGGSLLGGN